MNTRKSIKITRFIIGRNRFGVVVINAIAKIMYFILTNSEIPTAKLIPKKLYVPSMIINLSEFFRNHSNGLKIYKMNRFQVPSSADMIHGIYNYRDKSADQYKQTRRLASEETVVNKL